MKLEPKKLDELGFVGRGRSRHRPRGDEKLYGGIYPFIQTGDIQKVNFYISEYEKTYSDFGFSQSKLWKKGTLCISIVGANTAESGILAIDACFPDSVIGFISNNKVSNTAFVKYYLDTIKVQMKTISEGAARENLSMDKLLSMNLLVPEVKYQNKIASILLAYDDLIENNNQRILLLEEMAEEIYKEWFVRFRFPGYQNTKFFDEKGNEVPHGTKGAIPEGWEKVKLESKYHVSLGGTPSRNKGEYWDGEIAWINSGKVNDLRVIEPSEFITGLGLKKSATKLLPKKTTLLAITGATLGQVSFLEIESCTNQSIVGIKDLKNKDDEFIFLSLKKKIKDLINYAGGGAQQHINKATVENAEILIANNIIMDKFQQIIKPKFDLVANLLFKNQVLQETRDLLLPRLISGKLSVEHIKLEEKDLAMAAEPQPTYKT